MEVTLCQYLASKWASEGSTEQLANVILNCGVPVDTKNAESGTTLLHLAAVSGHTETVLLLLRLGAEASVGIGGLGTPLHFAAVCGHVSTVKAMLEAGCPVDVVDSDGLSVLYLATAGGNAEVVREVLSTGCDMNAAANDGGTPLHVAALKGNTEAALELIRHGAEKAIVAGAAGTPLHQAAVGGHVSTVKAMLEAGCPVDVVDSDGWSVLHAAAAGGNAEVVREVLSTGCGMNAADNDGMTPLHDAAWNGNTEAALELIRHGAEKAIVAGVGGTPLHQAARGGHVSTVKAMLEAGCPVDVVDSNGWSVLYAAAAGGNAEVVREVLSTGCDMNAAANDGVTPLHVAARKGNTEAALELIRHGAEKALACCKLGTPLHVAAAFGHVSTVKAMLEAGCPVDVVDSNGWSVLYAAAAGGNAEVVREVLSTGCDMNAATNDGMTPLHVAAVKGNTEATLELIRHGAEKAIVAGATGTPLHQAAGDGHVSTVKAMLEAGCPVDVVDSNGWTVLHFAAAGGNAEVVREVLSTGCDMNAAEYDGVTPLHMAAVKGYTEAALELIRHGAEKAIVAGAAGTPLHQAAVGGHMSTVKAMLEAGCPVDVVDSNGWSVLHDAAAGGNAEVVREVLSTACHVNATDNDGMTPLHVAAVKGNTEAALELIRHGAEKAIVADVIGTPLHQAARCGHVSTMKAMLEAGCPVDVVDSWRGLHAAARKARKAEMVSKVLSTGCDMNAAANDGGTPLHVTAEKGNTEAALEFMGHGAEEAIKVETMLRLTPLHFAVLSKNKDCVRVFLEHGADPRKPAPYIGSAYFCATSKVPAVVEAFDRCLIEEDQWLPEVHKLLPDHAWFHGKGLDKRSALVRDEFGISTLEYQLICGMAVIDELVIDNVLVDLSYINANNLLLLAAIHGLNTFVGKLTNTASLAHCPSFGAQTVTSLVNMQSSLTLKLGLQSLVPPDASLNLLHVAVLAMKGKCENVFIDPVRADYSSLLKFLVTSNSFHHTLYEYLPNGLTPLDLAEKLGLEEAATIISSAGGRHGIYTMFSNEVWLQYRTAILLAHQDIMKLISSGPLGQQIAQVVISQLPGKVTVEQGTATEESHLRQQKVLDQRPDMSVVSTYVIGLVNVDRWRRLGISLKIPPEALSRISSTHSYCEDRYLEVLIYWLDHNEAASWRALLEVLCHFETKHTMDRLTQDILAAQDSEIQTNSTIESSPYSTEIGATPPPPSLQLPPQFVSHVVHHVGVNWYNFALHLGISSRVLDVVREEQRGLTNFCCRESLYRWLRHDRDTGEKGREVGVVLEAVRKASGPVAVELIRSSLHGGEVRPTSPTPLLQMTPELAVLQEHVVPFVAAQWEAVADYLLVSHEMRAVIAATERGRVEVCCRELFNQWLQQLPGTGSLPRTWEAVLDVVREAVGPEVAKQIGTRLDFKEGVTPTPSP